MTDRELLDALARDVETLARSLNQLGVAARVRARHAAPSEPTRRWFVVDRREDCGTPFLTESSAAETAARWDQTCPQDAPHLAILAVDADDARRQYRERVGATEPTPAPSDDAGARLVSAIRQCKPSIELYDLARTVIAERDQAREMLSLQTSYSVELQRIIEGLKRGDVYESTTATHHVAMAREVVARAEAAERTVAELRALCGKAHAVLDSVPVGEWSGDSRVDVMCDLYFASAPQGVAQ